ncbi:glycosyltransferase family 4 protein [Algoriphagus halophytocola]|uniref:glycosyltransferase family 4 protein n=1 Tax=Algoriphagus halophytocola TaxID=2991499 RepID=UPI0022DE1FDA|nr:glycosyltransferase family 4 protein [Algoriphagus sp. TR-M9]WBL44347.1 glycosyltransferase family 4 protein [Algoriphagus sp. TR-M9]
MKVGIVTYALNIGGVERVILNLYQGLERAGYEPTVFEVMKIGEWSRKFQSMGLRVKKVLPYFWQSKKAHAFRILTELEAFPILFLNDVQYVHSILGFLPPSTRVFPIVHGNLESMLYNASFNLTQIQNILCVNSILAERLQKEYDVDEKMICVVSNSLESVNDPPSFLNRRNKFVYLGRLNDFEKGIMDIPEIFKIISRYNPNLHVDIYGSGELEEEFRAKVSELNLQKIIHLKGQLSPDRVNQVLSEYKYLIFPSKFESGALVLKEAMINGVVPFAYRLKGQTDVIITHGENGFMAEPGDVSEFAKNILSNYSNSTKMFSISENAIRTIKDKFSMEAMMATYLNIIEQGTKSDDPLRSSKLEVKILEEFPSIPIFLIRPLRKALRIIGLHQ